MCFHIPEGEHNGNRPMFRQKFSAKPRQSNPQATPKNVWSAGQSNCFTATDDEHANGEVVSASEWSRSCIAYNATFDDNVTEDRMTKSVDTSSATPSLGTANVYKHTPSTSTVQKLRETPKFHYDMSFDLRALQNSLRMASFLQDSGYRSSTFDDTEHSQQPSTSLAHHIGSISMWSSKSSKKRNVPQQKNEPTIVRSTLPLYGTGWMVADNLSDDSPSHEDQDHDGDDNWDGVMEVAGQKVRVKHMSDILNSGFAFISGLRTNDGHPILTFPDSHAQLDFEEVELLISYLLQVPPLEDEDDFCGGMKSSKRDYVVVIDRRTDKWSSVRVLFSFLTNLSDNLPICVAFLLKPEGVLQRALEVGYRNFTENNDKFKVVVCQTCVELRHYIGANCMTMDVGGAFKYNHQEWVRHRMDIERMKSSAAVIAESLSEFGRCLRETELPNDVETTERILEMQSSERDAIKEDFRISIRKGLSLLRQVRQLEQKPTPEQLSPTRLQNVTAIERMLGQLEDTERSFDQFWSKHRQRLTSCLQLRRFEEAFRKLQSSFAKHMLYLEEHREVGDGVATVERLAEEHEEYSKNAMQDVQVARSLKEEGEQLMASHDLEVLSADSLVPKCDELNRMAEALASALDRRAKVLRLSKNMHEQISQANRWCRRGVELLSSMPPDILTGTTCNAMNTLDEFLLDGQSLQLESLKQQTTAQNNLILLTTTDTSSLLAQVAERIEDIRILSMAKKQGMEQRMDQRRMEHQKRQLTFAMSLDSRRRMSETAAIAHQSPIGGSGRTRKPVQIVSPEKKGMGVRRASTTAITSPTKVG
ncbi:guanine nucleotide exchange factor DBS [Ditylenchus destructor]|nr:guanine nucleotide exchange factor DBS [Ditylenchus destructor]